MFAVIALAASLGLASPLCEQEATAAPVIQNVIDEARHDFELRHAELGLLGAAPLPGAERTTDL